MVPAAHGGSGLELLDARARRRGARLRGDAGSVPRLRDGDACALVEGGDADAQQRWLPRLASGEAIVTVALGEEGERVGRRRGFRRRRAAAA